MTETETSVEELLRYAEELKGEGNDHFRARRWEEALAAYRSALGRLPKHKPIPKSERNIDIDELSPASNSSGQSSNENPARNEVDETPLTEEEMQVAKARSVLNANIGACYVKLGEHKETVNACTAALLDDPHYVKALQRRAASNEQLNTWSSLSSAREDYNTLLSILPKSSNDSKEVQRLLRLLQPRLEVAQKQETAEMLDKLKGLGNNILGNFGLSTDNFKFVPNGQGGYSMNFSQ
ncbi:TPR-like protein [Lentinula lateritia]|uniref:TPR-like protein n=1 Tax=Lentinula lateritia TaxID=40482 RepID=A0ABQ8VHB5_9AGAR|nr:TPR-like protein [Lentinula lateritia]